MPTLESDWKLVEKYEKETENSTPIWTMVEHRIKRWGMLELFQNKTDEMVPTPTQNISLSELWTGRLIEIGFLKSKERNRDLFQWNWLEFDGRNWWNCLDCFVDCWCDWKFTLKFEDMLTWIENELVSIDWSRNDISGGLRMRHCQFGGPKFREWVADWCSTAERPRIL